MEVSKVISIWKFRLILATMVSECRNSGVTKFKNFPFDGAPRLLDVVPKYLGRKGIQNSWVGIRNVQISCIVKVCSTWKLWVILSQWNQLRVDRKLIFWHFLWIGVCKWYPFKLKFYRMFFKLVEHIVQKTVLEIHLA